MSVRQHTGKMSVIHSKMERFLPMKSCELLLGFRDALMINDITQIHKQYMTAVI